MKNYCIAFLLVLLTSCTNYQADELKDLSDCNGYMMPVEISKSSSTSSSEWKIFKEANKWKFEITKININSSETTADQKILFEKELDCTFEALNWLTSFLNNNSHINISEIPTTTIENFIDGYAFLRLSCKSQEKLIDRCLGNFSNIPTLFTTETDIQVFYQLLTQVNLLAENGNLGNNDQVSEMLHLVK